MNAVMNAHGHSIRGPLAQVPAHLNSTAAYEREAIHHLPAAVWQHIQEGSDQNLTLHHNRRTLDALRLCPAPLADLSQAHTRLTLFGQTLHSPIMLAPVAYHRLAHPEGELATVRAATALQAPMIVSTLSSYTLEEIAYAGRTAAQEMNQSETPHWFQLYWQPDPEHNLQLIERAQAAGYTAIVWTIDASIKRSELTLPPGVEAANLRGMPHAAQPSPSITGPILFNTPLVHRAARWEHLEWLRAHTRLPILVKGVLTPGVAQRAVDLGADGLIVSNHGGRVLDGVVSPIDVLPAIVQALPDTVPVLMDSGLRWGTDIVKALALGARAVLIGRPQLHALAVAGLPGVAHLLYLLRAELELAMAQLGCATLADIGPHLLHQQAYNDYV